MTPINQIESAVFTALQTYSNVHRGSGLFSKTTTALFDKAREIVLKSMVGEKASQYVLIFGNRRRIEHLTSSLSPERFFVCSSEEIGLAIGVHAAAILKNDLSKIHPLDSGGGTTRLVDQEWVLWAGAPQRFEAGTPAIINIITFAIALQNAQSTGDKYAKGTDTADAIFGNNAQTELHGASLLQEVKQSIITYRLPVPTLMGEKIFTHFDNAASTPAFTESWHAFRKAMNMDHEAKKVLTESVRELCSSFLNAPLTIYEIIFTSNTTEAINLAALNFRNSWEKRDQPVMISMLEHSANDLPWRDISNQPLIRVPVDRNGFPDLAKMEEVLKLHNSASNSMRERIELVSVCGASNVLGIYPDLDKTSRIAHQYGAMLLVDAAQMAAHKRTDMLASGIDVLALSGHKMHAPFGCGLLVIRKDLWCLSNAERASIRASGEENTAGIAALGKSMEVLSRLGWEVIHCEEQALTKRLLQGMKQIEGIRIHGIKDPSSEAFVYKAGVIPFSMNHPFPAAVAKELAYRGFGLRYGCHCTHILVKHILGLKPWVKKMQKMMLTLIPAIQLPGVVRVSLGIHNTREEVDQFIKALSDINRIKKGNETVMPAFSPAEVKKKQEEFTQQIIRLVFSDISKTPAKAGSVLN